MVDTYTSDSYWVKIYVAGPVNEIEQVCREYVTKGLCVNIKENKYIYKYGEETGVEIELINYPKYPEGPGFIWHDACELASKIMERICCGSYTVMDKEKVVTYDRRWKNL
jgi:hypothetical protein